MGTLGHLLLIAVAYAIVNNVVLSQFLGICPFLGVSKNTKTAAGMGGAVIFVITIATFVTQLIYNFILYPLNLSYLQTIVFILVIAALVQFVEMFLKKQMPPLYKALGVYLPLITTNCAVLGVALNSVTKGYNILESVVYGFATAFGFFIASCLWLVYVRRLSIMIFQSLSREQPSCFLQHVLWLSPLWDSQEWFLYRIGGKVI